jgi:sensor c-di-GMP phosphodiesterase-like protein
MLLHEVSEAKSLHPILTSIYQLCLDLKLDFIAEGVETAQHALLLQRLTPLAIGQGWWYGFPLPATDIIRHMLELAAEAK